jgi:hypothetical protein
MQTLLAIHAAVAAWASQLPTLALCLLQMVAFSAAVLATAAAGAFVEETLGLG